MFNPAYIESLQIGFEPESIDTDRRILYQVTGLKVDLSKEAEEKSSSSCSQSFSSSEDEDYAVQAISASQSP